MTFMKKTVLFLAAVLLFGVLSGARSAIASELHVCATLPDLGDITRQIIGDTADIFVFAKGPQNPHFIEARPSFIRALSKCDLYIQSGLDLETGWAPLLLQNARNAAVLPGGKGYLDTSAAITPMDLPTRAVDRSMGDVHAYGNPHYLLDPLNGLAVAGLIEERLAELAPGQRQEFEQNLSRFREALAGRLAGEALVSKYGAAKITALASHGKLAAFLKDNHDEALLGGWLGKMASFSGEKVAAGHNLWIYFLHRFGLTLTGNLEPKPGVPPTTAHLEELIGQMKHEGTRVILASVYFDHRPVEFVTKETGASVAEMAHQCGSREGTKNYLDMIDYNVRTLATALERSR